MKSGALPPVLATSVNPFGRLADQLACLEAWASLGFEVVTFNDAAESERLAPHLAAHGPAVAHVPSVARAVLPEADTGRPVFGKAVPRVVPVLERLAARWPGRRIVLANADIFPALDSAAAVEFWLAQAPAVALTREDCALLAAHRPAERAPYRNGLDVFAFTPGALAATLDALAQFPVRHRMAFGVPGWDFLLGAVVRSPLIGGIVMDGGVLLHERHPQTYAGVEEFAAYVGAMRALGETDATTAEAAAFDFHRTIVADCSAADGLAAFVRQLHYRRPRPLAASPRARDVVAFSLRVAPFLAVAPDAFALTELAERQLVRGGDLDRVRAVFDGGMGRAHAFAEELAATVFAVAVERAAGRAAPVAAGPADAAEREAAAGDPDPSVRRLRLARLFGDTLVRRRRFDGDLHDALALWCGNDIERQLLAAVRDLLDVAADAPLDAAPDRASSLTPAAA